MNDPNEIIKIRRVLEYEGPRTWVEHTLTKNYVQGERRISPGCYIREVEDTKPKSEKDDAKG